MSEAVKRAVVQLNMQPQGFDETNVSSHSLRAGGAMAMFLHGMSDTTIKKMGRWSSDTFLTYIHSQIAVFSDNILTKMATPASFHNVAGPSAIYQAITKAPRLITSAAAA